ncbi:MAG: hypothetical protein JNK15_09970 [Planctomycetes bacterium]|nr:hypothetical protein [Planctomycetota bacterium]
MLRRTLHVVLFLVALVGTAAAIRSVDHLPFWSWARPRLAWLQHHAAEFDVMFFGSSRVHYGIVPKQFDDRLGELGHAVRSCNAGLSGARPHDTNAVVSWLVGQRPARLRLAVVELHSWSRPMAEVNWMTDQEVESHVPGEWVRRVRSMWISTNPTWTRCEQLYGLTVHTLANLFRIGQGPRIAADLLNPTRGEAARERAVADAGYTDVSSSKAESLKKASQEWRDNQARREALLRRTQGELPADQRGGFDVASAKALAAELRSAGVQVVFLVMPSFAGNFVGRDGVAELAASEVVLELDLPAANPQLFVFDQWFDQSHMTRSGAEAFSRRLAEVMVEKAAKLLPR